MTKENILFLDTETTGLPFQDTGLYGMTHSGNGYPRFVQLAWNSCEDGIEASSTVAYVKPDGFSMPPRVSSFNGITNETLKKMGEPDNQILDKLMSDVRKADFIVGHNVDFDLNVLIGRLEDLGRHDDATCLLDMPSRDTMAESTEWCAIPKNPGRTYNYGGRYKYPRLTELYRKLFGKDFDNAHDAMSDIRATKECFYELRRKKIIP